jgi:hypothetical protein
LPEGPFGLVVSALAVHHLEGTGKAGLFQRIASTLDPAGRFVLADVVEPVDPSYVVTGLGLRRNDGRLCECALALSACACQICVRSD